MREKQIRVLIADDQAVIRVGLRAILEAGGLAVCGEAAGGHEALDRVRELRPDVVLMDIRMPDGDGIAATAAITGDPALADVKVIVLTTFELDEYVVAALRAGASGFLGKGVDPQGLIEGIHALQQGDSLLSPAATTALVARFVQGPDRGGNHGLIAALTEREREVLAVVGEGLSNDEIAQRLVISPLTAKTHVGRMLHKLGARDRAQLVILAFRSGLLR